MTDVGGKFSIDITPGVNWNLFTFMDEHPWIVIFKPGYGPLTPAYHRGLANFHEDLKQGAMVRLPRLKTRKELIHFADLGALGIGGDFPRRHIRNLLRLVNEQRKHLYLEPFPEAPGGRP